MSLLYFAVFFPPCCCARKSKTKSIIRGMDISPLYVYLSRSSQKSKEGPRTEKLPRDASTITSRTVLSPVPHLSPQYGSDSHARIKPTPASQASDLFCDYNYGAAPLLCVCVWGGRIFISNYLQPLHSLLSEDGSPRQSSFSESLRKK